MRGGSDASGGTSDAMMAPPAGVVSSASPPPLPISAERLRRPELRVDERGVCTPPRASGSVEIKSLRKHLAQS